MPYSLLLIIAGVLVIFLTTMNTLGWVLIILGIGLFFLTLALFVLAAAAMNRTTKNFYKRFNKF